MRTVRSTSHSRSRGAALLGVLFFILIMSTLLMGIGWLSASHQQRATMDANYDGALDLAEAAANYEFRRITNNAANADTVASTTSNPLGLANTSYTVQAVNRGTIDPVGQAQEQTWDLLTTGTYNGVSRQLRISGKGYYVSPNFAVYSLNSFKIHASNPTITGDCGTNGTTSLHGHISGSYYVDGPGASGSGAGANAPTVTLPNAFAYPTVSQVALTKFPNSGATAPGGLAYLALHNDNASAGLPTSGATITTNITLTGKPGGANFYLTGVTMLAAEQITFNNTNGPINVWVGPSNGAGMVDIEGTAGGTTTVPMSTNPVIWYVATSAGVQMKSSPVITSNFYVYDSNGVTSWGPFNGWNHLTVHGQIMCYDFFNSGDTFIDYQPGVPVPQNNIDHYGFDTSWTEIGSRYN